jgi:ABC-type dipeptide/oligopeptide/nickel transport system permease component
MGAYIVRRLLYSIITVFAVTSAIFFLIYVLPGDVALAMLGDESSAEALRDLREYLGLNRPLYVQYLSFYKNLLTGSLGHSLLSGRPLTVELTSRFPYSLDLVIGASIFAILTGIPMGFFCAIYRNSLFDRLGRIISLGGISIPSFFFGILLLIVFSMEFNWFPSMGGGNYDQSLDRVRHLILPSITLGAIMAAFLMRTTRSSVVDILREDYVRTAHAKGLDLPKILFKHVFRNGLIPVITVGGLHVNIMIGGAILTETVFSRPGLGRYIVNSLLWRDYPAIQACLLTISLFVILVNLLVDISYGVIDPRIRYE